MSIELDSLLEKIKAPDQAAMDAARAYQATLAKPPESLGRLEALSIQLAGITGKVHNQMERTHLLVFAADNGVVEEGVSSAPQSVTLQQTINLTRAKTGASTLCRHFGVGITVCDVGVNAEIHDKAVLNRKIAYGTNNIAKMPAMTREQAITAILTGAGVAIHTEADALGVGEMGIGNTTTSAAVLSALTGLGAEETCGRGGGVNDVGFSKKKEIVDTVSQPYRSTEFGEALDSLTDVRNATLEILATAGGFDICAMTGLYLSAAQNRLPIVIDGYISAVAALAAYMMAPDCASYMFASHKSLEKGYMHAMDRLGLRPFLDLDMRLGEGSGCPIAFEVLRGACDVMCHMATFDEAEINDDYLDEIREGDFF